MLKTDLKKLFSITFACYLLSTPCSASKRIKIENFVKLSDSKNMQVSPDGKYLSVVFRKSGRDFLGIMDRESRKVLQTFGVKGKGRAVGRVRWVNNTRLIYNITQQYSWDKQVFDTGELMAVNADGTKHKMIFGYQAGEKQLGKRGRAIKSAFGNQRIIDLLKEDDNNILIAFYPWILKGRYWRHNPDAPTTIYKLNVYTGQRIRLESLPLPESTAVTDNTGALRFSIAENDENELVVHYKSAGSRDWHEFIAEDFEGQMLIPLGFSEDNGSVYITANVGEGTRALYQFDIEHQTFTKLYQNPIVDISRIIFDFNDRKVVAVGTDLTVPEYHYLYPKDAKAKLHRLLQRSFKGSNVIITSATEDKKWITAFVYSDTNPGDFYLFDTLSKKAHYLSSKNTAIYPQQMANTKLFEVKTRDSETIRGYLTLPLNSSTNLPLVVLPHGGPHGVRDEWGYDWEVQLLASRGYAVLQVNFRGSGGFGLDFKKAGYGKWGTLMQDDLTDATKAVIQRGIADPKRVCIYGSSYGGYAALMGAVREPDLYRCAIGSSGVYNLPMMFVEGDIADRKSGLAYLKEAIGEDLEDQKKRSPVFNVAKIKADILLIHGAKDERAPIEQVESLKHAFDTIGKHYEWLELPYEGHGYYDESNRLEVYSKVLSFLQASIGN